MILLSTTTPSEGLQLASLMGYASFFFLAATVVLGMARTIDRPDARLGGAAVEQVHLACAVAGIAALIGHITAHLVREHGGMSLLEALVPFAHGGWIVGCGVLALLLLGAVLVTVPLRQSLGYRRWLLVHRMAYLAALLMAVHVIAAADEVGQLELGGLAVLASVAWVLVALRRRLRGADTFHHAPVDPATTDQRR